MFGVPSPWRGRVKAIFESPREAAFFCALHSLVLGLVFWWHYHRDDMFRPTWGVNVLYWGWLVWCVRVAMGLNYPRWFVPVFVILGLLWVRALAPMGVFLLFALGAKT